MTAACRFLDRWVIPAPIEDVYDAVGDPLGYARWWTDFVLHAGGDAGPPAPGKRNELLVKAYLPYKVKFGLEVVEAERAAPDPLAASTAPDFGRCRKTLMRLRRRSIGARWSTTP